VPVLLWEVERATLDNWACRNHERASLGAGDSLDGSLAKLGAKYILANCRRAVSYIDNLIGAACPLSYLCRGASLDDGALVNPIGEGIQCGWRGATLLRCTLGLIHQRAERVDLAAEGAVALTIRGWRTRSFSRAVLAGHASACAKACTLT